MSLDQAKELIKQGRLTEAEILLQQFPNDPTAQRWIEEINKRLYSQHSHTQKQLRVPPTRPKTDLEVIVTTGDLQQPYQIIGPVYFQVSNKGLFSSPLGRQKKSHMDEINRMRQSGTMSKHSTDWLGLFVEGSVGQNDFESAFLIAVRELQKRAKLIGGDAIVYMRQDIDIDTSGFQFFYLQMYGTAVRLLTEE